MKIALILRQLFFYFFAGIALSGCVTRFGQSSPEYREKAAYLFRLGQFVEWPDSVFANPKSPVVIGILGGNPFGDELAKIVKNENVNGHPIVVRRLTPLSNLKKCQILFVTRFQKSHLPLIFNSLKGAHVLTVSDSQNFLAAGGMIYFFMDGDRLRFEINRAALDKADLKMDSQLMAMAAP